MAASYSVVVVLIAVVLCGLWATGQACGSGGRDNQPDIHHPDPEPRSPWPDPEPWSSWPDPEPWSSWPDPEPWSPWPEPEPLPSWPDPEPWSSPDTRPLRRRREVQKGVDRQEQLVRYAREIMGQDDAATQKNMFQAIDMDSDGSISLSEWSRADVIDMIDLFCSPPQKQEKEGD